MSTSSDNRTIEDILLKLDAIPAMPPKTMVKEALEMMTAGRLGLACIVDRRVSCRLFTDGDLRRLLLRSQKPLSALFADDIIDHARTEFMSVDRHTSISEALSLLPAAGNIRSSGACLRWKIGGCHSSSSRAPSAA